MIQPVSIAVAVDTAGAGHVDSRAGVDWVMPAMPVSFFDDNLDHSQRSNGEKLDLHSGELCT